MIIPAIITALVLSAFPEVDKTGVGYIGKEKVKVPLTSVVTRDDQHYLTPEAALAFYNMHAAAAKDGIELILNSSFRTHRHQRRLYKRLGPGIAAKPGYSHHQLGVAVDIAKCTRRIKGKRYKTITYWWLKRNAKRFNFYQTLDNEPWHWQYIPQDL